MLHYKVWVGIERISDGPERYEDIGLPDPIAIFDTPHEARRWVGMLLELVAPDVIPDSDLVLPSTKGRYRKEVMPNDSSHTDG